MIYVIEAVGLDVAKVGHFRDNVAKRLTELQIGSPVELVVRATYAGDVAAEKAAHAALAPHHVRGEWFALSATIDYMSANYIACDGYGRCSVCGVALGCNFGKPNRKHSGKCRKCKQHRRSRRYLPMYVPCPGGCGTMRMRSPIDQRDRRCTRRCRSCTKLSIGASMRGNQNAVGSRRT